MQEYASLLWIVAIALVFWLLMIRPTQRRQKAMQELQSSLQPGDEVMLTSGVFGTVTEITDDHLGVEVAPGTVLRVVRGAIGSKVDTGATAGRGERGDTDDIADRDGDDASDGES